MKKIMLAVDGSKSSKKAAKQAANLSKQLQVDVIITTVIKYIRIPASEPASSAQQGTQGTPPPKIVEKRQEKQELEEEGRKLLDETESMMQKQAEGLQTEKELLAGDVAEKICDFARANEVDLIVVGNKGEGGIKRFLLGSTSEKVVRHAETSVLVVK